MARKRKASATVYVVSYALPGCLPDDPEDNVCFRTLDAAEAYIAEEEEEYGEGDYIYDIVEMTEEEAKAEGYEILD